MDHIIGKPSPALQRTHVLLVLSACLYILNKNPTSKTSFSSKINDLLASSQPWKIIFGSFTTAYAIKNLFLLTFLNSPEPMSTMVNLLFYLIYLSIVFVLVYPLILSCNLDINRFRRWFFDCHARETRLLEAFIIRHFYCILSDLSR